MEKSSIGKPFTCGLSLTQLDFPLRTNLPGNYNLIFIRFNLYLKNVLFNSEIYDVILYSICFTAGLKTTVSDLEEDLIR